MWEVESSVLQASPGKRYEPETSDGLDCNGGTSSSWGRCPAFGLVKCFPVWYCYRRHRKNGTARDLRALGHPVTRGPTQRLTMELTSPQQNEPFKAIIDRYERAFLERDLAAFRTLHVRDGRLVFFDNHSGCDSASYEDHEVKIAAWSTKSPRSARSSSTSRYDSEKRKYQPTASRIISGSNWRHLNRPATEGARTISAQLIKALLQSCNTSRLGGSQLTAEIPGMSSIAWLGRRIQKKHWVAVKKSKYYEYYVDEPDMRSIH